LVSRRSKESTGDVMPRAATEGICLTGCDKRRCQCRLCQLASFFFCFCSSYVHFWIGHAKSTGFCSEVRPATLRSRRLIACSHGWMASWVFFGLQQLPFAIVPP
jgi:hypothetical protein